MPVAFIRSRRRGVWLSCECFIVVKKKNPRFDKAKIGQRTMKEVETRIFNRSFEFFFWDMKSVLFFFSFVRDGKKVNCKRSN